MLDLMYTLPGQKKIRECVITREVVRARRSRSRSSKRPDEPSSFQLSASAHRAVVRDQPADRLG